MKSVMKGQGDFLVRSGISKNQDFEFSEESPRAKFLSLATTNLP